jgi:hypothetical protein
MFADPFILIRSVSKKRVSQRALKALDQEAAMKKMFMTTKKLVLRTISTGCTVATILFMTVPLFAQNYEGDARKIGMGGTGETDNPASKAMEETRSDRTFVLPFGLIQVAKDRQHFDPRKNTFDPSILLQDLADPIHYTFHRGTQSSFVRDLVSGNVNPDLSTYRGFSPASQISAAGLASPSFGHTFRLIGDRDTVHSIYVGAGPYLVMGTAFKIDGALSSVLSGQTPSVANTSLAINNTTTGQGALSFTLGYRGQFAFLGGAQNSRSKRILIATDYHFIHGLRYDAANMQFQFDTGASGLLTDSSSGNAATLDHYSSTSGRGYAVDISAAAMTSSWQIALGANGIGNRIEWTGVRADRLTLSSLLNGNGYVKQSLPDAAKDVTVRLPVRYNGSVAYSFRRMSGTAEFAQGFQGTTFHGGFEARLLRFQVRGGGRYSLNRWEPTAGLGLDVTKRIGLDLAGFQTTGNIERRRTVALAASIRIHRKAKDEETSSAGLSR